MARDLKDTDRHKKTNYRNNELSYYNDLIPYEFPSWGG